jgi:hypothetical protein
MYKIVGGDQREYGPITSEQIREWIAQGRANGQTLATFEGSPWKPLSTFPEFADTLRVASPPPIGQAGASGIPGIPGVPYTGAKSNTLSVVGLILSVILCCPPLSLVGLVLCTIGLSQIQKNPGAYTTSKIVPIIGIAVGLLSIALNIIAFSTGTFDQFMRNFPR